MDYFSLCPDTVLINIFQFISVEDLVDFCAFVCKRWHTLCLSKSVMKTKKMTLETARVDARYIVELIEQGINHIKLANLSIINKDLARNIKENNLTILSVGSVDIDIVEKILLFCPLITDLKLKHITLNDNVVKLIEANNKLEKLELAAVSRFESRLNVNLKLCCKGLKKFVARSMFVDDIEQILTACPDITDFTMENIYVEEFETSFIESFNFKKLEKLSLAFLEIYAVEQFLSVCPNLIDLTLTFIKVVEFYETFTPMETLTFKKLENLTIDEVNSAFLEHILTSCGNIKNIKLSNVFVNGTICELIAANSELKTLTLFKIAGNVKTPVYSLKYFPGCKKLKELHCTHVKTNVLEFMLSYYNGLEHLSLNCIRINETICQLIIANSNLQVLKLCEISGKVKPPVNSEYFPKAKKLKEIEAIEVDADVQKYILSHCDAIYIDLW